MSAIFDMVCFIKRIDEYLIDQSKCNNIDVEKAKLAQLQQELIQISMNPFQIKINGAIDLKTRLGQICDKIKIQEQLIDPIRVNRNRIALNFRRDSLKKLALTTFKLGCDDLELISNTFKESFNTSIDYFKRNLNLEFLKFYGNI